MVDACSLQGKRQGSGSDNSVVVLSNVEWARSILAPEFRWGGFGEWGLPPMANGAGWMGSSS